MTVRRTFRRILPALLALPLAALCVVVPAVASAASTPTALSGYFTTWQLGTPLPTVPAGYIVEALPSQASMKGIQPGTKLQMTPVSLPSANTSAADASAAATTALAGNADSAGYVNLEVIPDIGCTGIVFLHNDGSYINAVARSYSTFASVYQAFTYGKGQQSVIAAGISTTNGAGSFKLYGTIGNSTTDAQAFPNESGKTNVYWRSYFEWGRFYQACPPDLQYYYVYPYQWNGGDNIYHPGGPPGTPYCVTELAGGGYTKTGTTASTVGVAFNDTAVGFEGSSQTGYNTTAAIGFHYSANGLLCGQNNYPSDAPGVMNAAP